MHKVRMDYLPRHRSAPWVLAMLGIFAAGCDFPGKPNPADRPVREDQIVNFDTLYKTNCSACHGADGQLGAAPPLNSPLFLAIVPDDQLLKVVTEGRRGTPMPAFSKSRGGPLTDEQIQVLASGIKPRWAKAKLASATHLPPYLADTKSQSAQKDRGADVFMRACSSCHGAEGQGGHHDDRTVGAIHNTAFLSLISNQALRRYVITGRPDLGMPDYAGTSGRGHDFAPLSSAEIDDVVAYLRSWTQAGSEAQKP